MMGKRKRARCTYRTYGTYVLWTVRFWFRLRPGWLSQYRPVIDLLWSTLLRLLIIHCMADLDLTVDLLTFYRYNSHHNLFPLSPRLLCPSLSPRNFLARLQTLLVSRPRWQRQRIAAGIAQRFATVRPRNIDSSVYECLRHSIPHRYGCINIAAAILRAYQCRPSKEVVSQPSMQTLDIFRRSSTSTRNTRR